MARVLLVSFGGYPYTPSSLMPDNGLASLAGSLLATGHRPMILDYGTVSALERLYPRGISRRVRPLATKMFTETEDLTWGEKLRFLWSAMRLERYRKTRIDAIAGEVVEKALDFGADVVGLKLWNGDGFAGSVRIAEELQARMPKTTVIGGGPHVDYFGEHILDYTDAFDLLLSGEGERALPRLVEALSGAGDGTDIPGLIRRKGGEICVNENEPVRSLDELPVPVYDPEIYPALRGDEKIKIGVVDESRGCPHRCAFCIHPKKSGGKWALKSADRVLEEMEELRSCLGTAYFIYSGSNTPADTATAIAKKILKRGLDVRYGCFGHARSISGADFEILCRSGCRAIFYGVESGSPRVLKEAFNKPIDLQEAERIIRSTRKAGIRAITSLIFPAPFEDDASRQQTIEFLKRVRPDSVPVTIPGMIPGTDWETNPARYGFRKAQRKDLWEYALTYKIKLLFPPRLWKPLPYRLNDKSSRQLFRECGDFIEELEEMGILTNVPHEMVLMAEALGCGDDLRGFRDRCRSLFLSGAVEDVADMVKAINRGAAAVGDAGRHPPADRTTAQERGA